MLPSKKIIAFDLDGTLAESKQAITPVMAQALSALAMQKKVAVISGASMIQYEKQFLPYFDKSFQNLILMPTSGTKVYEYDLSKKAWTLSFEEVFPEDLKNKVQALLLEMINSGQYDIPKESYGERIEDRGDEIALSALGQAAPIEKKSLWDPDQKKRQAMKAKIESQIPEVSVSIGGMSTIDILPKGFSKAVSLKGLLKRLGLESTDLLYVGDALFPGGNDYSVAEAGFETVGVKGPKETIDLINSWID